MELRKIDTALLPAFLPYLVTEAVELIQEDDKNLFAFGMVTGDHHTCGAIAGVLEEGVLTLFSLCVDPAVRRQGIASQLLKALMDACPGVQVEASWSLPPEGWETVAPFFQSRGFTITRQEDSVYRLDTANMRSIQVIRRAFSPDFHPDGNVIPFSKLTVAEVRSINGSTQVEPRLLPKALLGRYDLNGSFAYRYRGKIAGWFLCGQVGERDVAILSAVSLPGTHPAAFLQMAAAGTNFWLNRFGGDYTIWLDAITEEVEKLARTYSGNTCTLWQEGHAVFESQS